MAASRPGATAGLPVGHAESDVVERPSQPKIAEFGALWHAKRRGAALPDRADFPVEELVPWLGNVIIMDVIDGGADFRYRLIGTTITRFLNRDYTGKTILESDYSGRRENVLDTFSRPLIEGRPVYREGYVVWAVDKTWRTYQSVHCPITNGGASAEMTIGVLSFSDNPVTGPNGSRWVSGAGD